MPQAMAIAFWVKAFLTLFVVIDPIGLAPIFITLVHSRSEQEQTEIARRAILVSAAVLLVFTLVGSALLRYLGISIEAFQVAAGILLFKIAVDMVFVHRERETAEEEQEAQQRDDVSVFPLAIPLIAGPGTLASILILVNEAEGYSLGLISILTIAAIVLLIAYVLLALSRYLAKFLGRTGINVVTRILGVLLTALAVQYISDGAMTMLKAAIAT